MAPNFAPDLATRLLHLYIYFVGGKNSF